MRRSVLAVLIATGVWLGGCSESREAGRDATSTDGSSVDANGSEDASHSEDASNVGAVSCDRRDVRCRIHEPACPEGQTAQVVGNCYGPCVPIDSCACTEADACPDPDRYTCHMFRQRCGPYL